MLKTSLAKQSRKRAIVASRIGAPPRHSPGASPMRRSVTLGQRGDRSTPTWRRISTAHQTFIEVDDAMSHGGFRVFGPGSKRRVPLSVARHREPPPTVDPAAVLNAGLVLVTGVLECQIVDSLCFARRHDRLDSMDPLSQRCGQADVMLRRARPLLTAAPRLTQGTARWPLIKRMRSTMTASTSNR